MARLRSMAETFRVAMQETLAATHEALVSTAKREHARVMSAEPRPARFQRFVDGREGALEEAVKPTGIIVYRYPRIEAVVQFALETLFDLSPVLSGAYRNSHTLFVNQAPARNLKEWRPGMEVAITSTLPYSRKIEIGGMKMTVPGTDMVYQQARRKVMSRYGNQFKIDFTYRAVLGGASINQEKAASSGSSFWLGNDGTARAASGVLESRVAKKHGRLTHNRSNLRFPALIITER